MAKKKGREKSLEVSLEAGWTNHKFLFHTEFSRVYRFRILVIHSEFSVNFTVNSSTGLYRLFLRVFAKTEGKRLKDPYQIQDNKATLLALKTVPRDVA